MTGDAEAIVARLRERLAGEPALILAGQLMIGVAQKAGEPLRLVVYAERKVKRWPLSEFEGCAVDWHVIGRICLS